MKKILLSVATLIALGATANAADLAARPYTKAPAYVAPAYNWTGFYIGGFVGGAFNGSNSVDALLPPPFNFAGNNPDGSFFGGGQIGYNYQFAPNWVLGIEGDIGGLSGDDRTVSFLVSNIVSPPFMHTHNEWLASVTGRLGYTWGAGMIYAKGGVAFRDNGGFRAIDFPLSISSHDTGYTIGGGLEYMFAPAWSAKIEYQYYNFDSATVTLDNTIPFLRYRDDLHTVKGGINYHFNWGSPMVARY